MLTAVLTLAAAIAAADDNDFKPFVVGGQDPAAAPGAAFDKVRDGMTLKELVDLLGPGYVLALSGTGTPYWHCTDGRELSISHVTEPKAVLSVKGTGGADKPWIKMWDKAGKDVELPAKVAFAYTDDEAAVYATRLDELRAEVNTGKRKAAGSLDAALAELKIDPKKIRGGPPRVGNATDWLDYPLSPNYTRSSRRTRSRPRRRPRSATSRSSRRSVPTTGEVRMRAAPTGRNAPPPHRSSRTRADRSRPATRREP